MYTMESIGNLVAEDTAGRFELIFDDERFQVREDTEAKRFYCLRKKQLGSAPWCEVEYVAAMEKEAWNDWRFASKQDEDEFTDAIAFCQVSGEVVRGNKTWIVWFDICDCD